MRLECQLADTCLANAEWLERKAPSLRPRLLRDLVVEEARRLRCYARALLEATPVAPADFPSGRAVRLSWRCVGLEGLVDLEALL